MKLTSGLFSAYLKCPTKCYLRSTGQAGSGNAYADWVREQNDAYRKEGVQRLVTAAGDGVAATTPGAENLKTATWRLAVDLPLETETMASRLHAVERVPSEGRGRPAQFVPVRFVFFNKLTKGDRQLVAFDALVLSEVLGREVGLGKIIHGDDHAMLRVKVASLLGTMRKLTAKMSAMLSAGSPPDLILNRHCGECEFRDECRQKAMKKDDLSLLGGMTEKERKKYHSKGIFTVTQLSYTSRPRRRPKRFRDKREKYHHSLKALAIREKKIHIVGSPELKIDGTPVYLDVEGLPDRDFYYLIGLRVGNGDAAVQHSLWADTIENEGKIWREFLGILEKVGKPVLVHYGSYESDFLKEMCVRYTTAPDGRHAFLAKHSTMNILSTIFAQIYFPCFTHALKDIGQFIEPACSTIFHSGIETIPTRLSWESSKRPELKTKLLEYNNNDCLLLSRLCEHILGVHSNGTATETDSDPTSDLCVKVDNMPRTRERWEMWSSPQFALADFKFINKCAYFDYQRERVFIRTTPKLRRINKRHARLRPTCPTNRTVHLRASHCPECGGQPINPPVETQHQLYDLRISDGVVRRWVTRCISEIARCPRCKSTFCHPDTPPRRRKYGNALMNWSVYLATYCGLNMNKTRRFMADVFGLSLPDCQYFVFKRVLAERYKELSQEILTSLLDFRSLHIDETSVNLKGGTGYVWVLASVDRAYYFYRPTREASFLGEMLVAFNGVLISDFYSGYDALKCRQQKCLIHFMRDINEDLLKCPFDCELKAIAERFGSLLRSIVEAIDRYGLKQRNLTKHRADAARFLQWVGDAEFSSDTANSYKKRLAKAGQRMFTFLEFDGIPWNNNNAEHAIKRFVKYRRETGGRFTEESLREYLILATVFETCAFNNVSALRFMLSGETTLAGLLRLADARCSCRSERLVNDNY